VVGAGAAGGEEAQYKPGANTATRFPSPACTADVRAEESGGRGKLGYSAYGSFGMLIHDLSDIRNPKLVGRFTPDYKHTRGTVIAFHTIDVARLAAAL